MKKLVVLSGAGMSAESGIGTFRDEGGLWEKYKIDDVATPNAWRKNKALVLDFYNQRRQQLFTVEPNAGHFALAELEKDFDVQIVTQNVDNLHERAGSTQVPGVCRGSHLPSRARAGRFLHHHCLREPYELLVARRWRAVPALRQTPAGRSDI